jgi:cytosine/adenosine deaminase-related metal-dependent hydrolase
MSYRKFRADHLFTGSQWLDDQHVLIANEEGVIEDIVPLAGAGEDVQSVKGILSPGFINCHCHLELSHLKGAIPEKTGMVDFLLAVMAQRNFSAGQVTAAIADAELSMLKNGIVAVGDICNTVLTIGQKRQGGMYYHNFIEAMGFVEQVAERRFAESLQVFEQFGSLTRSPIIYNSVVPHAPYSVSPRLFDLITHFPGNQLLTMHNQESLAEHEFFDKATGDFKRLYESLQIDISFFNPSGGSSLKHCIDHFLPNQTVILVHNAFTGEDDLQLLRGKSNFFFCLCPNANLYIGNKLPDIDMLRQSGIPLVVGTDSLASNHQLSVVAELKTIYQNYPHISIFELLQWATVNGARALDIEKYVGSFEKGSTPGIVLVGNELESAKRLM